MTKEDFLSRLKENKKSFKSKEELIEYQLPVLQYYLSTYGKLTIIDNRPIGGVLHTINFGELKILPSSEEESLKGMNAAFEELSLRIKDFE